MENHLLKSSTTTHHRCNILLGYPPGKKGWFNYNLETGVVSISQDVIFWETEFPYAKDKVGSSPPSIDYST